jgi:hypothetical protein
LLYQLSYNSTKSTEAQYCSGLGGGSEVKRNGATKHQAAHLLTGVNWQHHRTIDSASETAYPEKSIPTK